MSGHFLPETAGTEARWIIRDVLMHERCNDDDAIISASGIGGITSNPSQRDQPSSPEVSRHPARYS